MKELGKLDFKINVLSNGLEKYINFNINNKSIFVDSFKFFKFLSRQFKHNLKKEYLGNLAGS